MLQPERTNSTESQVEQFGMSRPSAGLAEVVERLDQAGTEVMFPDAVDDYPGRQRMVRLSQPSGERQAPAGLLRPRPGWLHRKGCLAVGQHGRHSWPDQPARSEVIAPKVDERR